MSVGKFEDLTGRKFSRLLVESRAENSNSGKVQWNCICDCGKKIVALAYNLKNSNTQSCGCLQRQRSSESKIKDITGKRFGRLVVIKRIDSKHLLCICDCGTEVVVSYGNLTSGNTKSCGCLAKELMSKKLLIDLTGQIFGELTVIKRIAKSGDHETKWLCKCSCGIYTIVSSQKLRTGWTQSCGHLRNSKPESIIVKYLRALNISYKKEYMFPDLLSKKGYPLRFDFKINFNGNFFLLEYQGIQNFRSNKNNFGKQQREITDIQKKEYCKRNNIELLEIKYNEDIVSSLEKILADHNLLHDNPVPSF